MADAGRASRLALAFACSSSVALGLTFVFIRAPHPWGWDGFDGYQEYARVLVRGGAFPTLEVPWGYPAFLALFYRAFGERPWIPLVAQVLLNSAVPLIMFDAVRRRVGEREARVTALLAGVGWFGTVYASTQISDSLGAFLFVASVALFLRGQAAAHTPLFGAAGIVAGLAMQVRPSYFLLPFWLAAIAPWLRPRPAPRQIVACVGAALLVLAPWVMRNARLTGRFIPASTHGGIQWWYGSLQVAPFFPVWYENPQAAFGDPSFPASPPDGRALIVSVDEPTGAACAGAAPRTVSVAYWTDRDPARVELPPQPWTQGGVSFTIPPQPAETAIYYRVAATWTSDDGKAPLHAPPTGAEAPLVHFVTTHEFADADRHGDLLDIFDVARLVRQLAWPDGSPGGVDVDRDGSITRRDLAVAIRALERVKAAVDGPVDAGIRDVRVDGPTATLVLRDGSSLAVPRVSSDSLFDIEARGRTAGALVGTWVPAWRVGLSDAELAALPSRDECLAAGAGIDRVFYREQPRAQDRYTRLARRNIARTPGAYVMATVRRFLGVFVVVGSDDVMVAHQFPLSSLLYPAAMVVSCSFATLFVAGVVILWRRGADLALVAAVLYVPTTLCPFLVTARYSVGAQPFMFAFVAVALVAAYDRMTRA